MSYLDIRLFVIPLVISFAIVVLLAPIVIPLLRRLKFGQSIRLDGPQAHLKKAGTPTMGGLMILGAIMLTALPLSSYLIINKSNYNGKATIFFLIFATVSYGFLGFLDDYIKIARKRSLGLTSNQKLIGQLAIGLILFWVLLEARVYEPDRYIFSVNIPILDIPIHLNWMYLPLLLFMMIGSSNAVNLTDGLDGLLAGTAVCAYGAYGVLGIIKSDLDVTIFSLSVVGALLGFLVFNSHPAKVFMGDTGSLALGGGLAALAVITKTELLLPIIGGVFVMETLSVIIQIISFKIRKKRVFRMSPLHHHYELSGWSEWRVVTTFWAVGLILAILGVLIEVF